ncbi:MAG: hypothetical protein IH886_04890 [Nitrospinae bacterium]|nr:hypothetical protein [Nitrospinota bacterium]
MNKGYFNLLVIALIFLAVFLVFHYQPFTWNTEKLQKAYEGNGVIKSIGGSGTGSGYEIEFDTFSLKDEFNEKFKIKRVPQLGKNVSINLRVFMGVEEFKKFKAKNKEILKSIIEIAVENSEGKKLLDISAFMGEFWFAQSPSNPFFPLDLYFSSKDKSPFIDQELWEKGDLIIHLHFKPGEKVFPAEVKGMLLVSCGGFK